MGLGRRMTPRNPVVAVVVWIVVGLAAITLVFTAFYFLDRYMPGGGMF